VLSPGFTTAQTHSFVCSGFAAGVDRRIVLQVRLRCTEGLVSWVYPGQALRVALEPNLSSIRYNTVCIQPSPSLSGASVFIERAGELELLETEDGGLTGRQVFCFRADGPHSISEGRSDVLIESGKMSQKAASVDTLCPFCPPTASCRPCNDTELLMAVCSSDFVVRGYIKNVFHDSRRQSSLVEVLITKVYWQRSGVFEQQMHPHMSPQSWHGHIRTLLQCHVKPGDGQFLFTGSEHFGEAWLGCAPCYKDFLSVYHKARMGRRTSCDFPLD
uniref:Meteorin-like protein n=1 Tax=Poecilia reticulata TaxID=8081 RepID=A0A3P9NHI9_POERE